MPVDYLGLRSQARDAALEAKTQIQLIGERYERAAALLSSRADTLEEIKEKVAAAARVDPRLRCAVPTTEKLNQAQPLPSLPERYTLIASDGSQINPNPHEPLHYFLINVGAIEFFGGSSAAPKVHTESHLHYAEYTSSGSFTDDQVSLRRDKEERTKLAKLSAEATQRPLLTLTDGPLELWGGKTGTSEDSQFKQSLEEYLKSLDELHRLGAATAGYVDKPRADLLVRMLEVIDSPPAGAERKFRGVTDAMLLKDILGSGQRSAVFATQSQSAAEYTGHNALHFFYLNVSQTRTPWLARVEIPAWVATNKEMLDGLHAVLIDQTKALGANAYPYVLHRAHEIALVKFEEHEQVSRLLINELKGLGIEPGLLSQKAASKKMRGRRRHTL